LTSVMSFVYTYMVLHWLTRNPESQHGTGRCSFTSRRRNLAIICIDSPISECTHKYATECDFLKDDMNLEDKYTKSDNRQSVVTLLDDFFKD
jgi:hypothetical protein